MNRRRKRAFPVGPGIGVVFLLTGLGPGITRADDEKTAKQIARLDAQFQKALTELARKYDRDQIPEAAHFFAGAALGFGASDEVLSSIKGSFEAAVYLGRLRGGEPLEDTGPITEALGGIAAGYKKILDPWIARARKGILGEDTRKLMFDIGVKYELARGAHEYVPCIQRFNALRRAMGVRAVLWDCEASKRLILAGWYTCETEDIEYRDLQRASQFYAECVREGRESSRGADRLPDLPENLRSYGLTRQQLLNPNVRALRLAYWGSGSRIDYWALYSLPELPYREDIPTPIQRFNDETVVKDWVDVENTIEIGGKKTPYAKYPFDSETNLPIWFSNGKGYMEGGWAKSEYESLERAGLPIMIRFFVRARPAKIEASLTDKNGVRLGCRTYANGDKRVELGGWATLLMIPERQLDGLMDYTVTIKCEIDSTQIHQRWLFKTRAR